MTSVTSKKSPNVNTSCPKMISLEKLNKDFVEIHFDTFTKIAKNVGNLGKIIVATGFERLPKCNKSPNLVTLSVTFLTMSQNDSFDQ